MQAESGVHDGQAVQGNRWPGTGHRPWWPVGNREARGKHLVQPGWTKRAAGEDWGEGTSPRRCLRSASSLRAVTKMQSPQTRQVGQEEAGSGGHHDDQVLQDSHHVDGEK